MAKYNISVDVGGTFTDAFITFGERREKVKVETTPHDLTVCLVECIEEGSRKLGVEIGDMLRQAETIRYSTTIATNTILQGTGPRIGLIVTKGFEDSLYDEKKEFRLKGFIRPEMIVGIEEEIDAQGHVVKEVKEDQVIDAADCLLDAGARVIVVSLLRSAINPSNERKVKEIINREYPPHYLGSVIVLLTSEVSARPVEYQRTNTAVLNSYIHADLVRYLYKGDEELSKRGSLRPMLVVHSTGGMATVAKTTALNTYNSGPSAGAICGGHLASLYGIPNLICVDAGGTSTDISIVRSGACTYLSESVIEGCPVYTYAIDIGGFGLGGGSIARSVDGELERLEVGPLSAGALPGPACFDLGGAEPTVCDALLVLGYFNPDYFLGGRRKLVKQSAVNVIRQKITEPAKVTVDEAALKIREVAERNLARQVTIQLEASGLSAKDCALLAYGGEGPAHCCQVASLLGIDKVIVPRDCDVLSAVGCSLLDVTRVYESLAPIVLRDEAGALLSNYEEINSLVAEMKSIAARDMQGQGFKPEELAYVLELEMEDGARTFSCTVQSPALEIQSERDVQAIAEAYARAYSEAKGKVPAAPTGTIRVSLLRLKATRAMPRFEWPTYEPVGENPDKALKTKREVNWEGKLEETNIYQIDLLECGNAVTGPAIIEAENYTCVVPRGWKYNVDKHLNGVINKEV